MSMTAVAVTGASGFIASHIVAQLLEKGYVVKGTVRDAADEPKTLHLRSLPGADARLQLFSVNMLGDAGRCGALSLIHPIKSASQSILIERLDPSYQERYPLQV